MVDRRSDDLALLCSQHAAVGDRVEPICADITDTAGRALILRRMHERSMEPCNVFRFPASVAP
jgi:hypothetical protein